jgi:hypothetical protein
VFTCLRSLSQVRYVSCDCVSHARGQSIVNAFHVSLSPLVDGKKSAAISGSYTRLVQRCRVNSKRKLGSVQVVQCTRWQFFASPCERIKTRLWARLETFLADAIRTLFLVVIVTKRLKAGWHRFPLQLTEGICVIDR